MGTSLCQQLSLDHGLAISMYTHEKEAPTQFHTLELHKWCLKLDATLWKYRVIKLVDMELA